MYNYDAPPGTIINHATMSHEEAWRYTPPGREDTFAAQLPIINLTTRLERFAVSEQMDVWAFRSMLSHNTPEQIFEGIKRDLEHTARERIAHYGLIIPDSMTIERDVPYEAEHDVMRFVFRFNALMPTFEEPTKDMPNLPRRRKCIHCETYSFEDKYHSGTCENCGAPYYEY
jgi:hypothetical protein